MSVLILKGLVEGGRVRLLDQATLPENTRVYIVVPDAARLEPRVWSPRLAEPGQAPAFSMEVSKARSGVLRAARDSPSQRRGR